MNKPFSLEEYQANPELKIVTRDGRNVKILSTDRLSERCIVAMIDDVEVLYYYSNGRGNGMQDEDCDDDLFFYMDTEPSAFEKRLAQIIRRRDGDSSYPDEKLTPEQVANYASNELIELLKNEISDDVHKSINSAREEGKKSGKKEFLNKSYFWLNDFLKNNSNFSDEEINMWLELYKNYMEL